MHCQIRALNEDRRYECRQDATVLATYPTGAIGEEWWYLCTLHFTKCVREDVLHPDEFPEDWTQKVKYLVHQMGGSGGVTHDA